MLVSPKEGCFGDSEVLAGSGTRAVDEMGVLESRRLLCLIGFDVRLRVFWVKTRPPDGFRLSGVSRWLPPLSQHVTCSRAVLPGALWAQQHCAEHLTGSWAGRWPSLPH